MVQVHVLVNISMENIRGQHHCLEKQLWLMLNGADFMSHLSQYERHCTVGMLKTGMAHNEVARRFGVHDTEVVAMLPTAWKHQRQTSFRSPACDFTNTGQPYSGNTSSESISGGNF